ncbi:MAG: SDR family oxidoreductase [Desulfobacterales bacterium]|nr:SDR family oxidoreductase [Desulfobacterales bacterium]
MISTANLMAGKTCLVTGANAGIGKAASLGLASMGATVVMVCRNRQRGDDALHFIRRETGNDSVHLLLADLSSQSSIRRLAGDFKAGYSDLHVLINNAGVVAQKRTVTEEGVEMQFAVNFLAPFLLTHLLLDPLMDSAPARVVNLSAAYHEQSAPINFEDLQMEREPYDSRKVYAGTKLAAIMFIYELARRLEVSGVTANCVHPGVIETRLMKDFTTGLNPFPEERIARIKSMAVSPEQAARAIIYLATSPELEGVSGQYFDKQKAVPSSAASYDKAAARRLWEASEKLTGL